MAKVFKSKIILGTICLILAAVLAFVALPSFYSSKSETTNAVKLNQDIHVGTVISGEMLSTVEVGSFGLPGSVVLNKDDAIGKVASENMYVGEYLTNSRLITEEEYQKLVAEQTKGLDKGYCLVTNSCKLYEVKHSTEITKRQAIHLRDADKCAIIEKRISPISGKYVLYRGEDAVVDGVQYLNVEKYLCSLR